jgi:NTP pyrophosphatase (non-canonical NTP hydrolase)
VDFEEYQREAAQTDRIEPAHRLIVSLLGLGGEAGSLLTEYKKHLRDGAAHARFEATVAEELGDVLWYVASIATHMNLDLAEIALNNIAKTQERWGVDDGGQVGLGLDPVFPDDGFPVDEQFPRLFSVRFEETVEQGRRRIRVYRGEDAVGDPLTDNAYDDDGYRYHDVFHLSYAVVLGWSPVLRNLLRRKRRSNAVTDEVEDGGRAQVIEEGVAAYVFEYARNHASLAGVTVLDYGLLRTVKSLTGGLEVSRCSFRDWERAILAGFEVWRGLVRQGSGVVVCDLCAGTLTLTAVPTR